MPDQLLCPRCGGEVYLDEDQKSVRCPRCRADFVLPPKPVPTSEQPQPLSGYQPRQPRRRKRRPRRSDTAQLLIRLAIVVVFGALGIFLAMLMTGNWPPH